MSGEGPHSVLPYKDSSLARESARARYGRLERVSAYRSLSGPNTHRCHKHLNGVEVVKPNEFPSRCSTKSPTFLPLRRNSFNPVAICRAPVQRNRRKDCGQLIGGKLRLGYLSSG
jgi:hypothetical protein